MSNIDLGHGFSYRFFTEEDLGRTGLIIDGPCASNCIYKDGQSGGVVGMCGGAIHFENSRAENRSKWKVVSEEPLTLSPSLECKCKGQHGHIVEGRYIPC